MLINVFVILIFKLTFTVTQYSERSPTVRLKQGIVTGIKVYGEKNRVDAFFGIPYAAPPINNLRFTPPQKHPGWNGTLEASNYGPPCLQIPIANKQDEDCLYLNIWTPEYWHRYAPKPVVIFFEGIEFSRSNQMHIPGQELAMEDVIVVTVNYRLNIFGFLCLGIPEARGNLGLLDQYFAILWVKQNIQHFGGNPEKINLYGYSSGAASAVLHITSPRTAGLLQRIILSSGSPTSPWHMSKNPFAASKKFASMLKCLNEEPKIVLKCMQSKSASEILKTYQDYLELGNNELFLPVVDDFLSEADKYLPNDPTKSLKDGTYVQVAIMAGISKVIVDFQHDKWAKLTAQGLLQLQQYIEKIKIPEIITRYNFNNNNKEQILELLKWRYVTTSQSNTNLLLKQLIQLEFESKIEAPHYSFLSLLESSYIEPIYAYHLDDLGFSLNSSDAFLTSDMLLLFGPLVLNKIDRRHFNTRESILSRKFKGKILNFINFGNPSPKKEDNWKRYSPNDYYVEYFNETNCKIDDEIISRNRRISFWTHLLPKLSQVKSYSGSHPKELLSPDPAANFKHAVYTLVGLLIALLMLLAICIFLLKKSYKERERHLHMVY
uniref:Carboxylic ester hydrolase n=1 Tax=Holotrichia parallela TaxID=93412 RepID=A0A6G7SK25_HOLPA|nr:carboxylesterase 19 [Holotrichia parallela]